MKIWIIEQNVNNHWEQLPNGEFDTQAGAEFAMNELQEYLGWKNLRIVEDNADYYGDHGELCF